MRAKKHIFHLNFLLIDDDPTLNQLIQAVLRTRRLRRLCESAIQGHFGRMVEVKLGIHYAGGAAEAREKWRELKARYQAEDTFSSETRLERHSQAAISFVDFDMPRENGLELSNTWKDELIEVILFTGRQPQMEAFLAQRGKSLEDFGVSLLMLKGAPAHELNDSVVTLLKKQLYNLEG